MNNLIWISKKEIALQIRSIFILHKKEFHLVKILKIIRYCLICRLPFNWKTPFGYLIATVFFSLASWAVLYALTLTLSFYAGACSLFSTFAKDITCQVSRLIVDGKSTRSHKKFKKRFCRIILLDSRVKQLSWSWDQHSYIDYSNEIHSNILFPRIMSEFNGIYEFITFNYFLWTILDECALFLAFLSQLVEYITSNKKAQGLVTQPQIVLILTLLLPLLSTIQFIQ